MSGQWAPQTRFWCSLTWTDIKYWQHWLQSFAQIDRNLRTLVVTVFRVLIWVYPYMEVTRLSYWLQPLCDDSTSIYQHWWTTPCLQSPVISTSHECWYNLLCHFQYHSQCLCLASRDFQWFPSWTISHRMMPRIRGSRLCFRHLSPPPYQHPCHLRRSSTMIHWMIGWGDHFRTHRQGSNKSPQVPQMVNSDHWNALHAGIPSTKAIQHCNNINAQWLLDDCSMIAQWLLNDCLMMPTLL